MRIDVQVKLENPVDLFSSLALKPEGKIKKLWDVERETLNLYHAGHVDKHLVAINLPTGTGKGIIGLLVLESWRRAGKRVAMLTSSNALCSDLQKRCSELGIESVIIRGKGQGRSELESREREQNKQAYKRKKAIGIMNYWAYMWGDDVAEAEVLVIDDADNFEAVLIQQSSIVIDRAKDREVYELLWNELTKYRIYHNLEAYAMNQSKDESDLIYFNHSAEMAEKAKTIILSKGRSNLSNDLFWSFDKNKDKIHTYLMYISGSNITFAPFINAGIRHDRLRNVSRIILMSATLGTKEMLQRMMAAPDDISAISEQDVKSKPGTMGKRVIFPIDEIAFSKPDDTAITQAILRIYEKFKKVLIMTPSRYDAEKISEFLEEKQVKTFTYSTESDVENFKNVGIGVLISGGRLIGLDLPDDTCRVAIITRMPFVVNPADAFSQNVLEDEDYVNEKVGHRLVQACGRCNRSPDDYAAYFVLDSRLASDISGDEELFRYFPSRMRAELDYSKGFVTAGGLNRAMEIADLLVSNKLPTFENEVEAITDKSPYSESYISQRPSGKEVEAWYNLTERLNYLDAARDFELCALHYSNLENQTEQVKRQRAWMCYLATKSYYLAFKMFGTDEYKQRAIQNLQEAKEHGYTSWFSGLQVIIEELKEKKMKDEVIRNLNIQNSKERILRGWQEFKSSNPVKKRNPKQQWSTMLETLQNGKHDNVVGCLQRIFELMGFEVRNTSGQIGRPDLLLFGNGKSSYLVIVEVKTKEDGGDVKREDVDQIGNHKPGYQSEHSGYKVYPLLFTNKERFSGTAVEKSKKNVSLLRAVELITFLSKYYELMEAGMNAGLPAEKFSVMEKMPTSDDFESIFSASENPQVNVDAFDEIIRW